MAYFPAFLQLNDKKVLLLGGGNIAFEKLNRLLDFTHDIKVVSLDFNKSMQALINEEDLSYECRAYQTGDIQEYSIVIIAVDDIALQAEIFEESKAYKCLCNAVDSVDYCDFIFPSYIKEGDLTVAISTSGTSPAFAKHFKRYLKALLPTTLSSFLQEMKALRSQLPKGKERMKILDEKAQTYVEGLKSV